MTLNSETLRRLRLRSGFTQQNLADRAKVSKRTIARLEAGQAQSENRGRTIRNLAHALRVDADTLSAPPSDEDNNDVSAEMQRVMTFIAPGEMLDYQMVKDRYDVSIDALVSAAPWMFVVLAEMSLHDRRERLGVARSHLAQLRDVMASHLGQEPEPFTNAQERLDAEEASLAADDVFGRMVLDIEEWPEVEDHPFTAFLASQAAKFGSPVVDPAELETQLCESLPLWSVHSAWLNDLSGGDPVAAYALRMGWVRVSDIPKELRGGSRGAERAAFLRKVVPKEEQTQIEKNQSNSIIGGKT